MSMGKNNTIWSSSRGKNRLYLLETWKFCKHVKQITSNFSLHWLVRTEHDTPRMAQEGGYTGLARWDWPRACRQGLYWLLRQWKDPLWMRAVPVHEQDSALYPREESQLSMSGQTAGIVGSSFLSVTRDVTCLAAGTPTLTFLQSWTATWKRWPS